MNSFNKGNQNSRFTRTKKKGEHNISNQIKETYQTVKTKVEEIDTKLGISTTAKQISGKVNEHAQKVDANLKISETMKSASQSAKDAASQINQKVSHTSHSLPSLSKTFFKLISSFFFVRVKREF